MFKVHEGRPNGIDLIVNGEVQLLINTPLGKHAQRDDYTLRQAAIANRVSYTTTMSAASAACDAILSLRSRAPSVRSLQEWHADLSRRSGRRGATTPRDASRAPTAFIHESATSTTARRSATDTKIWHFCHVMPGAVIGERCSLGQNVVVMNGTRIGNNVKIQNNVSIYEGVELEDDVFCGPSMVFTNVINPRSHVSRKNEYKRTLVRRGATIGANATIVCGVTLGEYAFVGAGAVVTQRRAGVRAGGRRAGAANRMDVPVRRAAAATAGSGTCTACGTTYASVRRRYRAATTRPATR